MKGLINSSRITPTVYEKGPTTIEDAIGIVEKISSAQCIAASFSQNHVMTGEVRADPMLDHTIEAEVQAGQDTPAQTGI